MKNKTYTLAACLLLAGCAPPPPAPTESSPTLYNDLGFRVVLIKHAGKSYIANSEGGIILVSE